MYKNVRFCPVKPTYYKICFSKNIFGERKLFFTEKKSIFVLRELYIMVRIIFLEKKTGCHEIPLVTSQLRKEVDFVDLRTLYVHCPNILRLHSVRHMKLLQKHDIIAKLAVKSLQKHLN